MKVERIIFFQGDGANEYLDLLDRKGERAVVKQLMEYWDPGNHDIAKELSGGNNDYQEPIKVNGIEFILTYNTDLNYIGLEHIIPPPKKKYYVVNDSIYSHITTIKPTGMRYETHETFSKAKRSLVEDLEFMIDEYRECLRNVRAKRKTDYEEEEE